MHVHVPPSIHMRVHVPPSIHMRVHVPPSIHMHAYRGSLTHVTMHCFVFCRVLVRLWRSLLLQASVDGGRGAGTSDATDEAAASCRGSPSTPIHVVHGHGGMRA